MKTFCFVIAIVAIAGGAAYAQAPAARVGDTTTHGGTVINGLPTVLIGGKPAARRTDLATCPADTPGIPPAGPTPHVGGPISTGSSSVLIGGLPAARVGDVVIEAGATSAIAAGAPTVLIGGN